MIPVLPSADAFHHHWAILVVHDTPFPAYDLTFDSHSPLLFIAPPFPPCHQHVSHCFTNKSRHIRACLDVSGYPCHVLLKKSCASTFHRAMAVDALETLTKPGPMIPHIVDACVMYRSCISMHASNISVTAQSNIWIQGSKIC